MAGIYGRMELIYRKAIDSLHGGKWIESCSFYARAYFDPAGYTLDSP